MKKDRKTLLIGLFVSLSLSLLAAIVLLLGSQTWWAPVERYILFFDQSINGLNVGSKVKFRGVPIGEVESVMIRAHNQRADSSAIPVVIRLNTNRIQHELDRQGNPVAPASFKGFVEQGLVGQLGLESFITGLLFVELSFDVEAARSWRPHLSFSETVLEVPTLPSSLDQITEDLAQLINRLRQINYEQLDQSMASVMAEVQRVLVGLHPEQLSKSMQAMQSAFAAMESTAHSLHIEAGSLETYLGDLTGQLKQTLTGLDQLLLDFKGFIEADSTLSVELSHTLREFGRSAQSVRRLAEYLERNPRALLSGRSEQTED